MKDKRPLFWLNEYYSFARSGHFFIFMIIETKIRQHGINIIIAYIYNNKITLL